MLLTRKCKNMPREKTRIKMSSFVTQHAAPWPSARRRRRRGIGNALFAAPCPIKSKSFHALPCLDLCLRLGGHMPFFVASYTLPLFLFLRGPRGYRNGSATTQQHLHHMPCPFLLLTTCRLLLSYKSHASLARDLPVVARLVRRKNLQKVSAAAHVFRATFTCTSTRPQPTL